MLTKFSRLLWYVCMYVPINVFNITLFLILADNYLRDASHHSVIYRHSDLDLSTVARATCGSSQEAIHRELLQVQASATVVLSRQDLENA